MTMMSMLCYCSKLETMLFYVDDGCRRGVGDDTVEMTAKVSMTTTTTTVLMCCRRVQNSQHVVLSPDSMKLIAVVTKRIRNVHRSKGLLGKSLDFFLPRQPGDK